VFSREANRRSDVSGPTDIIQPPVGRGWLNFQTRCSIQLPLLREVEGRGGERRCVMIFTNPSLQLSPRSCLAGRE